MNIIFTIYNTIITSDYNPCNDNIDIIFLLKLLMQ